MPTGDESPPPIDFAKILLTTIQFIISIIGLFMNIILLQAIYKNKHFRRIYDLLLATTVIYDVLNEIGIFVPIFTMTMGITVPLLQCFFILYIPTFALISTYQVLFFISVHRFWAASFPIIYKKLSHSWNKVYLCATLFYVQVFSFYVTKLEYQSILDEGLADKKVYCQTGEVIVGYGYQFSYKFAMIMNIATGFIYISIWLIMKIHKNATLGDTNNAMMERLNRSLAIIVFSTVSLWCISTTMNTFVFPLIFGDPLSQSAMGSLFNRMSIQLLKVAGAINLPIIYLCSKEYRKAIDKQFHRTFGCCLKIGTTKQLVKPSTNQQQISHIQFKKTNSGNGISFANTNQRIMLKIDG